MIDRPSVFNVRFCEDTLICNVRDGRILISIASLCRALKLTANDAWGESVDIDALPQ